MPTNSLVYIYQNLKRYSKNGMEILAYKGVFKGRVQPPPPKKKISSVVEIFSGGGVGLILFREGLKYFGRGEMFSGGLGNFSRGRVEIFSGGVVTFSGGRVEIFFGKS